MNDTHHTKVKYFIFKGISDVPDLQFPVFLLVLTLYLFSISGNMIIFLLICLDSKLHTPMYFFLGNLSMLDMSSTTIALHKVLSSFIFGDNTISFTACMTQMYIFSSLINNELLILTAMSYDRYVAICNALYYNMVMSRQVCLLLAAVCWVLGFIEIYPILNAISSFSCFRSININHFICDIMPLMNLSCSDTTILELYLLVDGILFCGLFPFLFTFVSYFFIIATILRIRSSIGRRKAFYTCTSHLTVISLLYITLACQYMRPNSAETLDSTKLFSLFNTVAVPLLNPLIYSLKNKDVKSALKRRLKFV